MNRVTILLDDSIREWLEREAERCGCKSMSTHVRHMLTEERDRQPVIRHDDKQGS